MAHVSVDVKKRPRIIPINLDSQAHIERQSVFQLETLFNDSLDVDG